MANEIQQKLGFDASNAINSLNKLQQAMANANQSMRNFSLSAKSFNASAAPMLAMMERMARAAVKISTALDKMGISAVKASASVAALNKPQGFAANMQRFDALSKSLQQAQQAQQQQSQTPIPSPPVNNVRAYGQAWVNVANIVKGLTIHRAISAITNEILGSVEAARKFGLQIAEIQTLAAPLRLTNQQLSRQVIELSNQLGKSASDVAEGLYQTLSNQVVEAADAFRFLEEAQRLAISTASSTEEAVDALSSVINSYSLGIEDTTRVSGQLFEIVNLGRVRLDEIADRIGRITPQAAQMGVSFAEVGAAIASMTVQGLKADTAITQLRAIMSKLQKPTEELQKVFRSWGVTDGEEALRTFGGLAGVLRKLSDETGGSSSEMAEFFNVVRAMTGVMGLGTDEGKRFAAAIEQIENASTKATDAFNKFLSTDAYSYTRQVNQLKNSFLQLGQALLPIANLGAKGLNALFGNTGDGVRLIEAQFNRFTKLQGGFEVYEKRLADAREKREVAFTRFEDAEWKKRTGLVRQELAKMGVNFNSFFAEVEAGQRASTAIFQSFAKDIERNYDDALNKIKDFSDKATDRVRENENEIRNIGNEISDIRFDGILDRATTSFQRMNLLISRAAQQMNEGIVASWEAGTDPERFKTAIDQLKRAQATAKQALSGAANQQERVRAENFLQTALQAEIDLRRKYNQETLKSAPAADALAGQVTAKGEELQSLIKSFDKAQKDFQAAETPAQKEAASKTIEELRKKITSIDFGPEADVMKKLGLDPASLNRLSFQLKETFNLKTVEWQGAQESLQAALDKASFKARVKMEAETGGFGGLDLNKAGKILGVPEKNSPAEFQQETITKAEELVKKEVELGKQLNLQNEVRNTNQVEYLALYEALNKELDASVYASKTLAVRAADSGAEAPRFDEAGYKATIKSIGESEMVVRKFFGTLDDFAQQVESGVPLTTEQMIQFNDTLAKFSAVKTVPEKISTGFGTAAVKIKDASEALKKAKTAEEELTKNSQAFQTAKLVIDKVEALGSKLLETQQKVNDTNNSINNGATGFQNQSGAVQEVQEQIDVLNGDTQALLTPINNATEAFKQMAMAASKASEASASATVRTALAGGPINFLAAGGRGQDRIPTMLKSGEFVVNSGSAGRFFSELNAMNVGSRPVFREQGGAVTNVGDINVSVKGGDTAQATVREIGQALRREIQRGNIKLK